MKGALKVKIDLKPLAALAKRSPAAFNVALKRGAVQFLTWCNTGSAGSSKKPPIRTGALRGSSSAFVGSELVSVFPEVVGPGGDPATPARSHTEKAKTTATFVWNTEYATKMHEWRGNWGPYTRQDGDAGAKWLEDHLRADREALLDMIGREFKKEAGL